MIVINCVYFFFNVFLCEIISESTVIKIQKNFLVEHIVMIIRDAPDNYEKVKSERSRLFQFYIAKKVFEVFEKPDVSKHA